MSNHTSILSVGSEEFHSFSLRLAERILRELEANDELVAERKLFLADIIEDEIKNILEVES